MPDLSRTLLTPPSFNIKLKLGYEKDHPMSNEIREGKPVHSEAYKIYMMIEDDFTQAQLNHVSVNDVPTWQYPTKELFYQALVRSQAKQLKQLCLVACNFYLDGLGKKGNFG